MTGLARCRVHINFESDEGRHKSLLLAHDHDVGAGGTDLLKSVLDGHWRNILATRTNNNLFDATSDLQVPILLNFASVTTPHKALVVDSFNGCLVIFKISHHGVTTSHADLTLSKFIRIQNLEIGTGYSVASTVKPKIAS